MAKHDWLKFYTSFKGRATRYDLNVYYGLVMLIGSIAAGLVDWLIQGDAVITQGAPTYFSNFWNLIVIVPTFAVFCRRLHDIGYSGWWQLVYFIAQMGASFVAIMLIPFGNIALGVLIMLVPFLAFFIPLSCIRGTKGPNRFGADPLEVIHVTE